MINKYKIYEKLPIVMLLAVTTGWVDALTFQYHDERFAAFQTGNIIQVGINLAHLDWSRVLSYLLPVIFFMVGAGLNYLVKHYWSNSKFLWQQASLLIQAIGILVAALFEKQLPSDLFIAILAMCMAFQADSFNKLNDLPITTVFSTGNLKNLGTNLMTSIVNKDRKAFSNAWHILLVIISFSFGAVASILLSQKIGRWTMLGASLILLIVLLVINLDNKKTSKEVF